MGVPDPRHWASKVGSRARLPDVRSSIPRRQLLPLGPQSEGNFPSRLEEAHVRPAAVLRDLQISWYVNIPRISIPQRRLCSRGNATYIDDDSNRFPTVEKGYPLSASTASEETLAKMKTWIDDCRTTHALCRTDQHGQGYMPKRVLRLTNDRIVLMEGAKPHTYACLSHCWGPSQSPIKTISTTIDAFKKDIPWRDLSKTFQDAVDICRRLGISYIWIDSLCIVQDSDEDWAEESAKMAEIYANAFLTIAATKSRDGTGGCYSDRDTCYVEYGTVIEGSVFVRGQMPRFRGRAGSRVAESWPLLFRGWVYQEMTLSARVLHFGSQEVVWQCRTHRRSESGSNDSDHADVTFSYGHAPPPPRGDSDDIWAAGSPHDHPWYDTVSVYSGLALSFDKDKLPALAAISQESAKERAGDDVFLAGLWKNSLLLDMLWETCILDTGNEPARRPTGNGAPSWSWAAVKPRVKWFMFKNYMFPHHALDCTKLEAVHVEPIGSPYLGRYSRCELIFRGPLIPTTSEDLEPSIFMKDVGQESRGYRIDEIMAVHQFTPDHEFDLGGPVYGPATGSKFILPLMIQHGGHHLVVGIVIRAMEHGAHVYERVGLVTLVYVKRGPPMDFRPEGSLEWDHHPWRPMTRQWINTYFSSLTRTDITLR